VGQLLHSIIQNSGQTFRSGEKFVWAVRQYLCVSLLKNGVSPIAPILQLSLDLFVAVIRFFKARTAPRARTLRDAPRPRPRTANAPPSPPTAAAAAAAPPPPARACLCRLHRLGLLCLLSVRAQDHLKSEIGVFFSNILQRILDSSNASASQKLLTVQCLHTLVKEPQLIVDLFLNCTATHAAPERVHDTRGTPPRTMCRRIPDG
jgi:Sec7-like guanine-nucleotide exchange factor